jgi:hypothetical protein
MATTGEKKKVRRSVQALKEVPTLVRSIFAIFSQFCVSISFSAMRGGTCLIFCNSIEPILVIDVHKWRAASSTVSYNFFN